jgi:hypothetical protein
VTFFASRAKWAYDVAMKVPLLAAGCLVTFFGAASPGHAQSTSGEGPGSGGSYFPHRFELPVPAFAQDDPRWASQLLGPTTDTLGDEGCTLTSVVMVLNFYGIETDPSRLNRYLTTHFGYDEEGLLSFRQVCAFAPQHIRLAYQGPPSYQALDEDLLARHPVILQLTRRDGATHFVVIAGKEGLDYLVRDPAADPHDGIFPLKYIAASIERQFLYLKLD